MPDATANKRIAKNTILLYFRSLVLIIISLYTSREILRALGVEDFGIYQLMGGVVAMFSLLSGSMSQASQRFITYAMGGKMNVKDVFTTSVTLHLVLGLLLVLLLEIGGVYFLYNHLKIPPERLEAAFWVLQCSIFTFFINILSVPYNSLIVAHERMDAFAYISILEAVLKLLSVYIIYLFDADRLLIYAVAIVAASSIVRLAYSMFCKRAFDEANGVHLGIKKDLFKEMLSFAGWNLWGSGSYALRNQGIDVLMNIFFGVAINAAKGVCNQVQNAVYQFVTNFQAAVTPQLTKSIAQDDKQRTFLLIFQGSRLSFYLLLLFSVPLIKSCHYVLSLWLVQVPAYAVEFVQWTMVYLLLDCLSRFLINAILANGNIRGYQVVVSCVKLLALPLAYIFFKIGWSPLVGVWVNILLEIICLFLRLLYNRKMIGLPVRRFAQQVVVKCWVVFGVIWGAASYLENFVHHPLLQIGSTLTLTVTLILLIGINRTERKWILSKIKPKKIIQ